MPFGSKMFSSKEKRYKIKESKQEIYNLKFELKISLCAQEVFLFLKISFLHTPNIPEAVTNPVTMTTIAQILVCKNHLP